MSASTKCVSNSSLVRWRCHVHPVQTIDSIDTNRIKISASKSNCPESRWTSVKKICAQDFSQFCSYLWWILWNWRFHAAECLANQQMNPGAYDWNHVNINIRIIENTSWLFQNSKWRDQYWYLIHLNASQYPTTKSINKNVDKGNASSSLRRAKPVWPPRNSAAWKIFCQQMPTGKQFQAIWKYCQILSKSNGCHQSIDFWFAGIRSWRGGIAQSYLNVRTGKFLGTGTKF